MDLKISQRLENEWAAYLADVRAQSIGRRIYIYGAGDYGRKIAKRLAEQGIEIAGFAVTQAAYNQEMYHGLPICAFSELVADEGQILFLVGVKEALQSAIERTLREAGATYLMPPKHLSEMLDDCIDRPVIEVTPKAGCSVHCRYCPQELFLKQYFSKERQAEMTFDEFRRYLDKMPQDIVVDFSGFVEPFLAKDGVKMVRYAHESGHDVRLFTTLVGLDREGFHAIEDIPFQLVVLHLPDVHHYANIPVTDEYLELLRYVVAKRRPDGEPFVDQANCQAEPDPRVAEIIGRTFPVSWDLIDRAGNLEDEGLGSSSFAGAAGRCYCGRAYGLNHNVLLPNGDVVLCCMDFGMRHVLGNLKRQRYEEIMKGAEMKMLQRGLAEQPAGILCGACTSLKMICV